jgi:hypothetical protein
MFLFVVKHAIDFPGPLFHPGVPAIDPLVTVSRGVIFRCWFRGLDSLFVVVVLGFLLVLMLPANWKRSAEPGYDDEAGKA